MTTTTHAHEFGLHPSAAWRGTYAACTACGFVIPLAMLNGARSQGASVTPELLDVVTYCHDCGRQHEGRCEECGETP